MTMLTLAAIAVSTVFIIMLCRGDPKRRRSARLAGDGHATPTRRLLAAAACLPGLAFALSGDAAAVLTWFGACAATGWLTALLFARSGQGTP